MAKFPQMTPGEFKFAMCVEAALNRIPEPEYRQLVVEMLMVLSLVVECRPEQTLGDVIDVDRLVWEGHQMYLKDQVIKSFPEFRPSFFPLCCLQVFLLFPVFFPPFLLAFPSFSLSPISGK